MNLLYFYGQDWFARPGNKKPGPSPHPHFRLLARTWPGDWELASYADTIKLIKSAIAKLAALDPSGKQVLHWDCDLKGFGALCSGVNTAKTYVVPSPRPIPLPSLAKFICVVAAGPEIIPRLGSFFGVGRKSPDTSCGFMMKHSGGRSRSSDDDPPIPHEHTCRASRRPGASPTKCTEC